jgi:hypothetical protein
MKNIPEANEKAIKNIPARNEIGMTNIPARNERGMKNIPARNEKEMKNIPARNEMGMKREWKIGQQGMKNMPERNETQKKHAGQVRNEKFHFIHSLGNYDWVVQVSYLMVMIKVVGTARMHRLEMSTTIYGELMEMALSL